MLVDTQINIPKFHAPESYCECIWATKLAKIVAHQWQSEIQCSVLNKASQNKHNVQPSIRVLIIRARLDSVVITFLLIDEPLITSVGCEIGISELNRYSAQDFRPHTAASQILFLIQFYCYLWANMIKAYGEVSFILTRDSKSCSKRYDARAKHNLFQMSYRTRKIRCINISRTIYAVPFDW